MMGAMASLVMQKKAERRVRQLLAEEGYAQPDEVEYGRKSVTMFWHSVKKSITVDVAERGEVGECRMGPPSPKWDAENGRVVRLATLREKQQAEQDARAMLDDHGLPQPDQVEYGATCIRLFWREEKVVVIVDINDPPPEIDFVQRIDRRKTPRWRGELVDDGD
jgi:hypothetical protein